MTKQVPNPEFAVRNSLFLHSGAVGDFVLTLHVAAALRSAFPKARIEIAARCPLARFAVGRGPIDAALDPDRIGLHHLYGCGDIPAETAGRLRRFDLVISFLGGPESTVAARLSGCTPSPVLSVDPAPPPGAKALHVTQQWLDALSRAGLTLKPATGRLLSVSAGDRRAARTALGEIAGRPPGRTVVCHPGSGGRAKCCPLETLEEVVRGLQNRSHTALWMIGPAEFEWHGAGYIQRLSRTAPVLFEESLLRAARLLMGADCFIGHDAGMTHLAAGLGLPTVALFGPTDPRVWRPLGPGATVLRFDPAPADSRFAEDILAVV